MLLIFLLYLAIRSVVFLIHDVSRTVRRHGSEASLAVQYARSPAPWGWVAGVCLIMAESTRCPETGLDQILVQNACSWQCCALGARVYYSTCLGETPCIAQSYFWCLCLLLTLRGCARWKGSVFCLRTITHSGPDLGLFLFPSLAVTERMKNVNQLQCEQPCSDVEMLPWLLSHSLPKMNSFSHYP